MFEEKMSKEVIEYYKEHPEKVILVSRHLSTVKVVKSYFPGIVHYQSVTADQLKDVTVVIGNLPMMLAAEVPIILAAEFISFPPRGKELSEEELEEYGLRFQAYHVSTKVRLI